MNVQAQAASVMDRPIELAAGRKKWVWIAAMVIAVLLIFIVAAKAIVTSGPTVERSAVVIDVVNHGRLENVISGPGKIVPAEERVISAPARALVDAVDHDPGVALEANDSILRLVNPDTELAFLEAQREWAAAQSELVNLRVRLDNQLLDQGTLIQQLEFEQKDAERRAVAYDDLAKTGGIANLDLMLAHDRVVELESRIEIEGKKRVFLDESRRAQLDSQRGKTDQLENLVRFREELLSNLAVRTPIAGVLQDISVEEGQWVEIGQVLARVSAPDDLKVMLRLPQTDADDISVGQKASIDTRIGVVAGHVARVDPAVQDGAVIVEVLPDEAFPKGARSQLTVYGTINAGQIEETLSIRRPVSALPNAVGELFKVDPDSMIADRVKVRFGESMGDRIELVEGGQEGDRFIVSDVSTWEQYDSFELKH